MNGPEILAFTLEVAPPCMAETLERNGLAVDEIDWFVFHQASFMLLERLREELKLPKERFVIDIENYGNTVSSTIPLALYDLAADGRLKQGDTVLTMGFGVGLSWGGTVFRW